MTGAHREDDHGCVLPPISQGRRRAIAHRHVSPCDESWRLGSRSADRASAALWPRAVLVRMVVCMLRSRRYIWCWGVSLMVLAIGVGLMVIDADSGVAWSLLVIALGLVAGCVEVSRPAAGADGAYGRPTRRNGRVGKGPTLTAQQRRAPARV
jgi:hypothetical protein